MGFRNLKWQAQFREVLQKFRQGNLEPRVEFRGSPLHTILVHAVTGAGKSRAAAMTMQELDGRIDQFVTLVPRHHLVAQQVGRMDDTVPYDPKKFIDPFRGHKSLVLTYQRNTQIDLADAIVGRFCLILDESHHLRDGDPHADRGWLLAACELAKCADLVICLTGTLSRPVGRIAFTEYEERAGAEYPVENAPNIIRYTRADALEDHQIKPLSFRRSDGEVRWTTDGQAVVERRLSKISRKEQSIAVRTVLTTGHAKKLLISCLDHWSARGFGKVLVVCHKGKYARSLYHQWKGTYRCELALSEDGDKSKDAVSRFQRGTSEVLFSIAMCHEGLDVEKITHVCYLSNVRWSVAWIEQCFGRAIRVCEEFGPWVIQRGYIFVPDDPVINAVIDRIRSEQPTALFEEPGDGGGGGGGGGGEPEEHEAQPIGSDVDRLVTSDLDANHPELREFDAINAAIAALGRMPTNAHELQSIILDVNRRSLSISKVELPKRFTDEEDLDSLSTAFEVTVGEIVDSRGLTFPLVNGYLKQNLNGTYGERICWTREAYMDALRLLMRKWPEFFQAAI